MSGRENHKSRKIFFLISIISIVFVVGCDSNEIPKCKYYDEVPSRNYLVLLDYQNKDLVINDSAITNLYLLRELGFSGVSEYIANTKFCLPGLSIDKDVKFEELEIIFKRIEGYAYPSVFLVVNAVKDSVGFNLFLPNYRYTPSENYRLPDTLFVDNYFNLYNDSILLNKRRLRKEELDRKLKEIVQSKEIITLEIDKQTSYGSIINFMEEYHKYRQYFRELYSIVEFNKEYDWFYEYPEYFKYLKQQVDEEYRSKLYLTNEEVWAGRTVITSK